MEVHSISKMVLFLVAIKNANEMVFSLMEIKNVVIAFNNIKKRETMLIVWVMLGYKVNFKIIVLVGI